MMVRFFATPADFHAWLAKNHATASELWVGYYKRGTGKPSITWPESVAEAICYGWIDGLRKSVDEESYRVRFTPRKPTSTWSAVNIRTANRLIKEKRMQPAGMRAFEARRIDKSGTYSYENRQGLTAAYEKQLKSHKKAWAYFSKQAPWYRKTAGHWVMSAKREETRLRRLAILIADSEAGRPIKPLQRPTGT